MMRKTLENKAMHQLAITGLLLALLCPVNGLAATDSCNADKVEPFAKGGAKANDKSYCSGAANPGKCNGEIQEYVKIATDFVTNIKNNCAAIAKAVKDQTTLDSQAQGLEAASNVRKTAMQGAETLSTEALNKGKLTSGKLKDQFNKMPEANPHYMLASTAKDNDVEHVRSKVVKSETDVINKNSDVTGQLKGKVGSLAFGSELRSALHQAKDDFDNLKVRLSQEKDAANPNGTSTDTTTDTSGGKKGGGIMDSLNPSTLMGLATAGMGLAAAMKKNPDNSSVSTPSDTTPPVTAVGATGLGGDGKSASQSPNMSTTATKTETPNSSSGGSPGFYGSPFAPDSDVTSKSSRLAGSGNSSPATTSGASGLEGFGGGSGSSRSPDSAAKDPNAALAKPSEDPMAGGFGSGGGGGGGLNFGSSSSTSSESSHPEDPLKETLQDMAAAVDSGNGSTGTSADGVQADGGGQDYGSSNEFLFTRVRSAIQRSLKKGGVVSGLSAKIR